MTLLPLSETSLSQLQRLSQRSEQIALQSDAELLELFVAGGDRAAFEALVVRYAPLVSSVCALTVSDRDCAEDAFQATFLILLVQAQKIRKRASLVAWRRVPLRLSTTQTISLSISEPAR